MAKYDDGYSRAPGGTAGLTPVVKALLIANTVIALPFLFLIDALPFLQTVFGWFALDIGAWRAHAPFLPVWQLVTYGFLHDPDRVWHLLMNLLWLYFAGVFLESLLGARRFVVLYLLGLVVPALLQVAVALVLGSSPVVVGASGAILMLFVAAATLYPRQVVMLFGVVPMPMWLLAAIVVLMDLFGLVRGGEGTAYLVHLGGAALGFVLAKSGAIWFDPFEAWAARKATKQVEDQLNDEQRLDELLARIHREGIGSLSGREREFLKRMSARRGERL